MKKLLLSFLLLLPVVLGGFRSHAADYTVTVQWDIPGSVEVIKGSSPTVGTYETLALEAGQTSLTITGADHTDSPENYYWFKAAEDYTLQGADNQITGKASIVQLYSVKYFKLSLQYESYQTALDGKTFKIDVAATQYAGSFTLNVDNGADRLSAALADASGNERTLSGIRDGLNNVRIIEGENTLVIRSSDYKALYEVKSGDTSYEYKSFKYSVPVTDGSEVYIAATDPALADKKYKVTFNFTNDNPECVTVFDWTSHKMVDNFAEGFEVAPGTEVQVSAKSETDYTYTSLKVNGAEGTFGKRYAIDEDTEFTVDATAITYQTLEATLYTNDIDAFSFSNSTYDSDAKAISVTKVEDKGAGTVCLGDFTIPVATTQYTLDNISGKTKNVFFDVKQGYWIKNAVCGNPEEPGQIYLTGAVAFNQSVAPIFLEAGKIEYDTPVMVYYEGPASTTRLRARFRSAGGNEETVPYQGAGNGEYLVPGWNRIMIDPDYNNTFEISMAGGDATEAYTKFAVLDGKVLTPNSDTSDNPGVYQNVKLEANSVLQVFFAPQTPSQYTLSFITAGDARASLRSGAFTISDFSRPISLYGTSEYTVEAEAGTTVKVDGEAVSSFTPKSGNVTKVQLSKEGYGTLGYMSDPESGATVKTLSSVSVFFPVGEAMFDICDNAAAWITVSGNGKTYAVASVMPDETKFNEELMALPVVITLAEPVTEAGTYTINMPAGVVYETYPDAEFTKYERTAESKVNPDLDIKVTVDPAYTYEWSFSPADGSDNDMPEDNVLILLSLPKAKTLDSEAFTAGSGPWLSYNDQPIAMSDDLEETPGWTFTQSMATWGKPALLIEISKEIFSVAGKLTITADEGAFTVNGAEPSPAINFTARFGAAKDYTYEFTPAVDTEISDWQEFKLTFPEAETVALDEDNAYFILAQGFNWGVQVQPEDVTIAGNTVTFKAQSEGSPKDGTITLRIGEGSFILDGTTPSPEIMGAWTYTRTSGVDFSWNPSPDGKIVNAGYGFTPAIVFSENEIISYGSAFDDITVKFNDEILPEYDYDDEGTMGCQIMVEYGNPALMIMVAGGAAFDKSTTGTLSISIPAGALTISGKPNPEAIEYTWQVIEEKEYTWNVTPADGLTVKTLSEITLEFPDAETATLSEYFNNGWVSVKQGYSIIARADKVETVADSEHPAFRITLTETIEAKGDYTVEIFNGSFTLDGAQSSPAIRISYTVDPDCLGINGIEADDSLHTVVNLQGIVVLRDADSDALRSLPAGIYIVYGKKISIR